MALHSTLAAVTNNRIRQHGPVGVPALCDGVTQAAAQRAARITALGQDDRPVGRVIDDRAIVNGIIGLLATGSSTHHTLHLVAIKRRAGLHAMGDPITFIKFLKVTPRFFSTDAYYVVCITRATAIILARQAARDHFRSRHARRQGV